MYWFAESGFIEANKTVMLELKLGNGRQNIVYKKFIKQVKDQLVSQFAILKLMNDGSMIIPDPLVR